MTTPRLLTLAASAAVTAYAMGCALGTISDAPITDARPITNNVFELDCHSLTWVDGVSTEEGWSRLFSDGWVGVPEDGTETIYSPSCFAIAEDGSSVPVSYYAGE